MRSSRITESWVKEIRPPGAEAAARDVTRDTKAFTAAIRTQIFSFLRAWVNRDDEAALAHFFSREDGDGNAWTAERLRQLQASGVPLQRLAVSCGLERGAQGRGAANRDPLTASELASELWQRHALVRAAGYRPLWQLDGRPMSGDVGAGTARAAVKLLEQIRPWAPPGPLQLAGGTNANTLTLLDPSSGAAGVAFGGVARSLLQPLLQEAERRGRPLRELPELREQALKLARGLVEPWLER